MKMARARTWLVVVGGGALLVAMAVDTLAMLGRQLGVPLLGAIEIVQAAVLVAGVGALVVATADGAHARVHLVLDRLPAAVRSVVERAHALAAVLVTAALFVGSAWISVDLWGGHEESELLHIPYRPLRVVLALGLVVLIALAARRVWRPGSRR